MLVSEYDVDSAVVGTRKNIGLEGTVLDAEPREYNPSYSAGICTHGTPMSSLSLQPTSLPSV
jgi:hypothetical protein